MKQKITNIIDVASHAITKLFVVYLMVGMAVIFYKIFTTWDLTNSPAIINAMEALEIINGPIGVIIATTIFGKFAKPIIDKYMINRKERIN